MAEQRSSAWFEKRRGRLTGSNVGAALGLNPHKTPGDLIRQMVRDYHGVESEFKGNQATQWGTFNEDGAQQDLELRLGKPIQECGFFTYEDWLGASPDGLVGGDWLVEIKCPFGQRDKNPPAFKPLNSQPHYYAQVQVELLCTGREWCAFYQWAPHGDYLEIVQRNQSWLDEHLPILRDFYDAYLAEIDNPDHLEPKLKEFHSMRVRQLVEEYHSLSEAIEMATERRKEVLSELVGSVGERDALVCGHKLTKVKRQGSVSYAKALKDHAPDIDLEPYRGNPSEFWKLTRSVKG